MIAKDDARTMLCISSIGFVNAEGDLPTTAGCVTHDRYFADDVVSVVMINR